jgi:hypothetical protein
MTEFKAGSFIVIVAPCPLGASAREGWMSRIGAVDRLFEDTPRIYIDPYSGAAAGPPVAKPHGQIALEYRVDLTRPDHHALLERLVVDCRFVYVHTAHLGRFLLPFYPTGKIITDMHGIVPEEERMLGRPVVAAFYDGVERVIMQNAQVIVVVTDAMRDHLLEKYPNCRAEFICLPIIEDYKATLEERVDRAEGQDYRVIYAGGTQVWQNIDRTIQVCEAAAAFCSFEFLSIEHDTIRARASGMTFVDKAKFGVVDKKDLPGKYLASDFGLVLRDDTAVNRVSCPTKLSEYLWFGVIPIVKTEHVGDFLTEGFSYVTDVEFVAGLVPDEASCAKMRRNNRLVLDRLSARYDEAAETLRGLTLPNLIGDRSLAGLPIGKRHLTFPNHAELYLFAAGMHHFVRDVIDSYAEMRWEPDIEEPVRAIRVIPVVADVTVSLTSIELMLNTPAPTDVVMSCVTPGQASAAGVRLNRATPYFDLHFGAPVSIRDVTVRWGYMEFGSGVTASRAVAATDARTIDVILRSKGDAEAVRRTIPIAFVAS